jgi:hypothetical protein
MTPFVFLFIYFFFSYLVASTLGRTRKLGFGKSLLICLICSPFLGFLIILGWGMANPKGCKWCGNKDNEAEFCGLCGKNEHGEIWKGFQKKE